MTTSPSVGTRRELHRMAAQGTVQGPCHAVRVVVGPGDRHDMARASWARRPMDRSAGTGEVSLHEDQVAALSPLLADAGHAADLDEAEPVVEADRCGVAAVDRGDHDPLAAAAC